jgi:DNA-3-methyladenine glycosylase II
MAETSIPGSGKRSRRPKATKPRAPQGPARAKPAQSSLRPRIITSERVIRDGVRALRRTCPIMRKVHDATGDPPLRRRPAGFEGLARIIVGQQLSVASATAIWSRTELLCRPFEPAALMALEDPALAAAGLSRPKIRTLRAIATACTEGLALSALDAASDEDIHAALTAVNGIGPWTADVYIMFCLGRADAFAPGDLALQIGAQKAFGLRKRPDAAKLLRLAERWRPWRGVAARLLWSYYAHLRAQRSAVPV